MISVMMDWITLDILYQGGRGLSDNFSLQPIMVR